MSGYSDRQIARVATVTNGCGSIKQHRRAMRRLHREGAPDLGTRNTPPAKLDRVAS